MPETVTQRVRKTAFDLGEFTMDQLEEAVPVKTMKELQAARHAIKRFIQEEEIIPDGPGRYRYQVVTRRFPKVARMWRAMRLKESFTQKEIVKLTGASRIHARKYFIQLKKQGLIEVVTGQGYEKGVFRLKDPAGAPLEYPKMLW